VLAAGNDARRNRMSETCTYRQADRDLPHVERVPAPWVLAGNAWIVVLRWPRTAPAARAKFVPDTLSGSLSGPLGFLVAVDYVRAPCGPYRELLLIPGSMLFADGRRHLSISRILVSTWESVVNGRANWGIPKDRADFRIEHGTTDRIVVSDAADAICALEFAHARGPDSRCTPHGYHGVTLVSRNSMPGARTISTVGTRCWCVRAVCSTGSSPRRCFRILRETRVLASLRAVDFTLTFPVARTT
jgi:hypothetical protein